MVAQHAAPSQRCAVARRALDVDWMQVEKQGGIFQRIARAAPWQRYQQLMKPPRPSPRRVLDEGVEAMDPKLSS